MSNITTYNQTLTVLQDIATRHFQLNTFGVGKNWEIGASEELIYPLLWVQPINALMERGTNEGYAAMQINMELKVIDLVDKDEGNEDDVQSDTLQILQDIITEFTSHPFYTNSKFDLVGDLTFLPLDEVTDEQCNGWAVEVQMRTPYQNSFCGIPVSEITDFSFPSPNFTGLTVESQFIIDIINTDGNLNISSTGQTFEINSTQITTNTTNITNNTTDLLLKYDKAGGTITGNVIITGTTHQQENIFFTDRGSTITSTGTTFDLSTGNIFINSLSGATQMDYSNAAVGTYIWEFNGQTTGSSLTFASGKFQVPGGTGSTPTLTATAGAIDMITSYFNGDKMVIITANDIQDI